VDKVERDCFRAVREYTLEPLKEQLLVSLDIAVGDENVPELIQLVLLDMREAQLKKLSDEVEPGDDVEPVGERKSQHLN
jgi:hypothetical protein